MSQPAPEPPKKTADQAVIDPVAAYLERRLRAAEDEALAANVRLRQAIEALSRLSAIAERFKAIAEAKDRELAEIKAVAGTAATPGGRTSKAKETRQ